MQLDFYGELLDVMELLARAGIARVPQGVYVEKEMVTQLEAIWTEPGHGIWEQRGEPQHYTHSKVMAWVGIDRYLRSASARGWADAALQTRIHAQVCSEDSSEARGHFVQHHRSGALDASLMLPLVGFLPTGDTRMRGTIAAVERELVEDGLVRRTASDDEGASLSAASG